MHNAFEMPPTASSQCKKFNLEVRKEGSIEKTWKRKGISVDGTPQNDIFHVFGLLFI